MGEAESEEGNEEGEDEFEITICCSVLRVTKEGKTEE